MTTLLEVAVDTIPDAVLAERAGARRIELCANLQDGGTTPSAGSMRTAVARVGVPVFAMIRPRSGDFLYSAIEVDVMLRDIEIAKQCGVHGIVCGALQPQGVIDEEVMETVVETAAPLPVTFHRAFDQTRNLTESLDRCLALGIRRVLSSGGRQTAREGEEVLTGLVARAGQKLTVVGGGSIRAAHLRDLVSRTGLTEVHLGPRRPQSSAMRSHGSVGSWRDWEALDEDALRAALAALG